MLIGYLNSEGVKVQDRFILGAFSWIVIAVIWVVICVVISVALAAMIPAMLLLPAIFLLVALLRPDFRNLRLIRLHKRLAARNAVEELENDGARRPVFYLRAFKMDGSPAEDRAVAEFRKVGPVIALGRPNEILPPLGAARFYVSHERWQTVVAEIARISQLVIWTTGSTEGLRWEINHLLENISPEKLVLWVHPQMSEFPGGMLADDWHAEKQNEWTEFLRAFGPLFPHPLPARLNDMEFICFDKDFVPIPVCPTYVDSDTNRHARAVREVLRLKGYDAGAATADKYLHYLLLRFSTALSIALLSLMGLGDLIHFFTPR